MKLRGLAVVCSTLAIVVASAAPIWAQNQVNLGDGLINAHFNGNGTPVLTMVIPSIYYIGGYYQFANGSANATGQLQSTGSYLMYTPSSAPFFLTHNPDDSFTITQTSPIYLSYTSAQGTLTGQITFSSISKTGNNLHSTMIGLLTQAGGSFGHYFVNGGHVTMDIGLTFPLQILYTVNGFTAVEVQSGNIVPAGSCQTLTQGYWKNHQGAWQDGSGLSLGTTFYTNSQLEDILNTPVRGDASVDLAHQLIAALLNIANGTSSIPIQTTLNDAATLLGSGTVPENIPASSPVGQQMTGDASILNDYNNGQITGACQNN
jgi:hypothetical protein